jgi:hypothetical protein
MKLNFVILPILFIECNSFGFKFHTFLGEKLDEYMKFKNETMYKEILKTLDGQTFRQVSTWADKVKSNIKYQWTKELHYVDVEECGKINNLENYSGGLYKTIEYLKMHSYKNLTAFENLALLIHLTQDLFQPLHSFGAFRGGNDKKILLKRKNQNSKGLKINYHQLFDSFLPEFYIVNNRFSFYNKTFENILEIIQKNVDFCCKKINWNNEVIYLEDYYYYIGGNIYYDNLISLYIKLSEKYINI